MLRASLALLLASSALVFLPSVARADDADPAEVDPNAPDPNATLAEPLPPPQKNDAHTWFEGRLGYASVNHVGMGNMSLAMGAGFTWIDFGATVGLAHQFNDGGATMLSLGPEIATRTNLGGGGTLRLAVDPIYGNFWSNGHHVGLYGADVLAELLWDVDNRGTGTVTRLGIAFHGGGRWLNSTPAGQEDHFWMIGADFVVRSWW